MKKEAHKKISIIEIESISCDWCKKEFDKESLEFDNFNTIFFDFTWGSKKDGDSFEADICEECATNNFKNYWRKRR